MTAKNPKWSPRNLVFWHFNIRRRIFPAHQWDRLVLFIIGFLKEGGGVDKYIRDIIVIVIIRKQPSTKYVEHCICSWLSCWSEFMPIGTNLGLFRIKWNWKLILKSPDLSHLLQIWFYFSPVRQPCRELHCCRGSHVVCVWCRVTSLCWFYN